MANTKREKESLENSSPLRSLNSFKSEIPGSTVHQRNANTTENSKNSFVDCMEKLLTSAHFLLTILLFVFVHCILLTAEIIIAFDVNKSAEPTDMPSAAIEMREDAISALSATCLAILAVFLFEVILRIFCFATDIKNHKMDVFDGFIVAVTFILDLTFHVTTINTNYPWTRMVGFLILLRLWRLYGIYWDQVSSIKKNVAYDLEMAKYGRHQAEVQADILQSQCDSQLKEIAHLRIILGQHNLDPDSPVSDFMPSDSPYHLGLPGYSRTISLDRAETFRAEQRLLPVSDTSTSAIFNSKEQNQSQGESSTNQNATLSDAAALQRDTVNNLDMSQEEEEAEEASEEFGVCEGLRDAENGEVDKRRCAENGEITTIQSERAKSSDGSLKNKSNAKRGGMKYHENDLNKPSTSKAGIDNLGFDGDIIPHEPSNDTNSGSDADRSGASSAEPVSSESHSKHVGMSNRIERTQGEIDNLGFERDLSLEAEMKEKTKKKKVPTATLR